MKHLLLILIFCLPLNVVRAQEKVNGKVIDSASGEPLPFAAVYLLSNLQRGTVTNLHGEFVMNNVMSHDTLVIDYLGYRTLKVPVSEIIRDRTGVIQLTCTPYAIRDITVYSQEYIKNIVSKAYNNVGLNYPDQYYMAGLFRKQNVKDGEYVFFGECNMDIVSNPLPKVVKTGKTVNKRRITNLKITSDNTMEKVEISVSPPLFLYPLFSVMTASRMDNYEWRLTDISEKDGDTIMQIAYEGIELPDNPNNKYDKGSIYISSDTYAVVAFKRTQPTPAMQKKGMLGFPSLNLSAGEFSIAVYYIRYQDKWYFNYGRNECSFNAKYKRKDTEFESPVIITVDYLAWKTDKPDTGSGYESNDKDPFKGTSKYPKTDASEFTVILPDYEK